VQCLDDTAERRWNLDHGLGRFNLGDRLIDHDLVADGDEPAHE
jgi:hypothetical protein